MPGLRAWGGPSSPRLAPGEWFPLSYTGTFRSPGFLIDLHSHTDQSDGTLSPAELVAAARTGGVEVLGITDHDTFAGHDLALDAAQQAGVELVCGIELSTKLHGR